MRWWCSAGSAAWTWTWTPYVGVWLFVAAIVAAYVTLERRAPSLPGERPRRIRTLYFSLGVFCLWGALDWPVGPLGANYLASVHMGQFLLVGLLAPLLLLLALPRATYGAIPEAGTARGFLEWVTHPVIAFFVFNGVITVTHWPSVTDALMVSQAGSFLLDMMWIVGGLVFWWPLVAPVPARPRFHPLARLAYLGFNIVIIRPPMLILFYSEFPVYSTYELAPPLIPGASPVDDQQLAAGLMKVGSAWIFAIGMLIIFLRWHREQIKAGAAPSTVAS